MCVCACMYACVHEFVGVYVYLRVNVYTCVYFIRVSLDVFDGFHFVPGSRRDRANDQSSVDNINRETLHARHDDE